MRLLQERTAISGTYSVSRWDSSPARQAFSHPRSPEQRSHGGRWASFAIMSYTLSSTSAPPGTSSARRRERVNEFSVGLLARTTRAGQQFNQHRSCPPERYFSYRVTQVVVRGSSTNSPFPSSCKLDEGVFTQMTWTKFWSNG